MHVNLRHSILLLVFASSQALAADVSDGKRVFDRYCAECHAPGVGHPGTQQLGWTRGNDRAVLEKRRDLAADYISFVVRNGLLEMPAFRPTEISDSELRQLSEYLTTSAKKTRKPRVSG